MKNQKTFLGIALAFVVLMGGAYILYDQLGGSFQADQLAVQEPASDEAQTPSGDHAAEGEAQQQEPELVKAPDFTVYDGDGNEVSLSDFVGKPVVLNFWASWCGPCKSEMPDLDEAYSEYGEEIHFLMVNMTGDSRETAEAAAAYIEENGFSFPVFYDTDSDAAITYGVTSLPTTYFIDAEGNAIAQGRGALDMETLKRGISMIYEEESAS